MNFLNIGEITNYIKNNFKNFFIILLLLLLIIGGYVVSNKIKNTNNKYEQELKLREALTDTIEHFKTENGEYAAEKRTLQADIKELKSENINLNENQKDLINRVERLNRENKKQKEIFAAARVEYETLIDSLNSVESVVTSIDSTNNTLRFTNLNDTSKFIYDVTIVGVKPFPKFENPKIQFNKLDFPNVQTVTFQFDKNKRKDYPISFSVYNTNRYYRANNIESYAIPELTKDNINPSFSLKAWRFIKKHSDKIIFGGIGYGIGKL